MTRSLILPPLRRTASDAERFARVVHEGQTDKAGEPYWCHLARVAAGARRKLRLGMSDELFLNVPQIAWLHDVIEDTEYGLSDLASEGFEDPVLSALVLLTKVDREPYAVWIARLCREAPLPVLIVKLADMEDNADPVRLALLPEDVRARLARKYCEPLAMLRAAVERERA